MVCNYCYSYDYNERLKNEAKWELKYYINKLPKTSMEP